MHLFYLICHIFFCFYSFVLFFRHVANRAYNNRGNNPEINPAYIETAQNLRRQLYPVNFKMALYMPWPYCDVLGMRSRRMLMLFRGIARSNTLLK